MTHVSGWTIHLLTYLSGGSERGDTSFFAGDLEGARAYAEKWCRDAELETGIPHEVVAVRSAVRRNSLDRTIRYYRDDREARLAEGLDPDWCDRMVADAERAIADLDLEVDALVETARDRHDPAVQRQVAAEEARMGRLLRAAQARGQEVF